MAKAKPFIKWVGGKGQLIEQLEALLPADFAERENVTYIEPFVGGGAMLFYMLQTYPNIFFLNRTCFNGLYRVNKAGKFNVPFGKYTTPTICDSATIYADSKLLQKVDIMTGDFEQTFAKIEGNTFFYFDPPYRPLSNTSSFNDYTKEDFNDNAQIRLKLFCDRLNENGINFILSNSDCLGKDGTDRFFDDLFIDYSIERVWASRNVNAIASKRGKLTEIVVNNYHNRYLFQR